MTDDPGDPAEIRNNLESLARQGKHIKRIERWILIKCYEKPFSPKELAQMQGVTRQAIYPYLNRLKDLRLIDIAYKESGTSYYKCRFDLSETADYTYRFRIRKQNLIFEDLLFFLYHDEASQIIRRITSAIGYLYWKSVRRANSEAVPAISGAEVKSFVLNACSQLEDLSYNIKTLVEGRLFEQSPDCHELYGPVETEYLDNMINYFGSAFVTMWNEKAVSAKGVRLFNPKIAANRGRMQYRTNYSGQGLPILEEETE